MKMNPPKKTTFWISAVLAILGLLGSFISIPFVSGFAFWFVVIGYVVLVAGLFIKGF